MRYRPLLAATIVLTSLGGVHAAADPPADMVDTVGVRTIHLSAGAFARAIELGIEPASSIDYGTFYRLELSESDFARLIEAGTTFQEAGSDYTLRLGEHEFDLRKGDENLAPSPPRGENPGPDLHLIQLVGPTKAEWIQEIEAQGLQIVQYIHPFTYIVWGDTEAIGRASALDVVRGTGPFAPEYRLLPKWRNLSDDPRPVKVLMYRGAETSTAVANIEDLGGASTSAAVLNNIFEIAGFTIAGSSLDEVARVPGVYSVQLVPTDGGLRGEMSDQVNANNVDEDGLAFPGYPTWLDTVGSHGTGVIIANVDGGIQDSHPDLVDRLIACTGETCGGSAQSSHGTHTAGIMAADGSSGVMDSFGFLRGLGVAPDANLVEQRYSPFFTQPGGMLLLMTESQRNGASLSGNSWGPSGSPQGYDDDTLQVDIGVRDADPDTPGNQPLTYVLSIMNGYGGTSSQGTPDEAKNIFTIGSTKMQSSSGEQILEIDDLSSNSAHGPALDGRKIPHMVAPGCRVDSSVTSSGYGLLCGTSMASPHVSGAVALFVEYYRNLEGGPADPSPAMIKAAFLPVAHDLAGHSDADGGTMGHPFDNEQGWGRMDIETVIDPQVSVRYFDNPIVFDDTGEEWAATVSPLDPDQPMRIMLVWTDAPGHGLGGSSPAWNNDLDLVVEVGADTYLGNNFGSEGWSETGGAADGMNNTEGVFLGPTAPASATIIIVAANINSDGIPNEGDTTDQDFAVACYNCAEEPDFTVTATPAELDVTPPQDAVFDVAVGQILGYLEPVTLSVVGEPTGTTVNFSTNPVTPPGTSLLTIGDTADAALGSYDLEIVGVSTSGTHSFAVRLNLLPFMILSDDFETDLGWTVENIDLTRGAWERGQPISDGSRGDPTTDYDGSGKCYLTDNAPGNSDVDGGPTLLISPTIDLSAEPNPDLSYARWFTNDDMDSDRLDVAISNDDGDTWVLIESVPHTEGWVERSLRIGDYVAPTALVKVRFSAIDNPNNSVTEAAIDAVRISRGDVPPLADFDLDGDVDLRDFAAFQACFGEPATGECEPGNLAGGDTIDLDDYILFAAGMSGPQ